MVHEIEQWPVAALQKLPRGQSVSALHDVVTSPTFLHVYGPSIGEFAMLRLQTQLSLGHSKSLLPGHVQDPR